MLVGSLTRDPELRHTQSGKAVCSLRLAVNTRRKDEAWTVDKPNYFDITVWGNQGERCAQYLPKGRPVAIDGRLEWREWETPEGTSARRSTWSPTRCSSSAAAATASGRRGSGGGYIPSEVPRPWATSRPRRPTTTSRSRRLRMAAKTQPRKRHRSWLTVGAT